jgi:MoaA/NifB/PqqE/SkfB family radical SAM enzyme
MDSDCLANTTRDYGTRIPHVSGKIIGIQPVPEYFSITWMLGSRCNYDCMYCPSELHDSVSTPHDLETMQMTWRNIYEQAHTRQLGFKISFTGGEVTANKNFLPLIQWMRESYPTIKHVAVTTNGSASRNYYLKLADNVESISFSTHSEHMDEQEFFNKSLALHQAMIRPQKSFHVNIMDEHWNQHRIPMYKKWLSDHDISHSINMINLDKKIRDYPILKGRYNLAV